MNNVTKTVWSFSAWSLLQTVVTLESQGWELTSVWIKGWWLPVYYANFVKTPQQLTISLGPVSEV